MSAWALMAVIALAATGLVSGGYHEKRLLNDLLDSYNVLERPVGNESEPLVLSFGLTLMQIIDVDEKNQLLITNLWLKLEWIDVNMCWNTSEYGEVSDLRIPPHRLWKPDVLMYNSADEGFDGTYPTNVVVKNNGTCLYVPPGIFKSTCKIDITWFPFDDQRCEMKFGSWTYNGFQLDLQLQDDAGGDITSFITNGEWDLLGVPGKRNEIYYNCCPEPYIDITFVVIIRRRTLYYFFNLIVPCVLIASMAVLGFTLPPDSGEKLSLGVTILLSLTVFLNMVAETMPATSDAVPLLGELRTGLQIWKFPTKRGVEEGLERMRKNVMTSKKIRAVPTIWILDCLLQTIGILLILLALLLPLFFWRRHEANDSAYLLHYITVLQRITIVTIISKSFRDFTRTYFNCIMFMVASSVVSTILILNYHHRNADTHEMSEWVRVVFLYWLPCMLGMSRPIEKEEKDAQKSQKPSPVTGTSKAYGDLELHQRSSKSLLANVLDLEDNALASHNNLLNNVYSTPGPHHHTMGHGHSHIHTTPHHHHSHAATTPHHQHSTPLPHSSYPGHQVGHTPHHHQHPPEAAAPQVETILQSACFCARYELILILKEIKIITDKLKNDDLDTKVTNDWKFAAMVIDRMCLIIFTLFTIIATITVLLSAPHIIVT